MSHSRIERAFERRFREVLVEFGVRDRVRGTEWLFQNARRISAEAAVPLPHALAETAIALLKKAHRLRERRGLQSTRAGQPLICDAGLGGLARWLRAAGCDAHWMKDVADADLVAEAKRQGGILVTTDSLLLDRRPIVHGEIQSIWVPPALTKVEQLQLVRAELNLPERASRCMRCGGELTAVQKEAVREQIPPKTYAWVDDYFQCRRCGKLYWHGTHWRAISKQLMEN